MIYDRKGVNGTTSNFLIISVVFFGVLIGGIILNNIFNDVESPIIVQKCKSANPFDDVAFFECVKGKVGSEKKAADIISKSSYALSKDVYLSSNQGKQPTGCYDYDGGLNYFVNSNATIVYLNGSVNNLVDRCDGSEVIESYCINQTSLGSKRFACASGCLNGICTG